MTILFKTNELGQIVLLYESAEEGKCWFNMTTHKRHLYREGDLKEGRVYEAEELNHIRKIRDYLPETIESGWITPEGYFWGCRSENHDAILAMFFGLDRGAAEKEGWIHVYPNGWYIGREVKITNSQAQTLANIGRNELDKSFRDRNVQFRAISEYYEKGYPLTMLPCDFFTLHRPEVARPNAATHSIQPQLQTSSAPTP